MAYIKKKSERKFKITVCNGYKVNGQKRMKAQTITVPPEVPKRGIQQYVMAEAERIEKKFKYGVEESDQTHFDRYAESWNRISRPLRWPDTREIWKLPICKGGRGCQQRCVCAVHLDR